MKTVNFQNIIKKSLSDLNRRIKTTKSAANGQNQMIDCGWSDAQFKASWLECHYAAVVRYEKILKRFGTGV